MKRPEQLRQILAETVDDLRSGAINAETASAIARLADSETRSVGTEIAYHRKKTTESMMPYFEDDLPKTQPS